MMFLSDYVNYLEYAVFDDYEEFNKWNLERLESGKRMFEYEREGYLSQLDLFLSSKLGYYVHLENQNVNKDEVMHQSADNVKIAFEGGAGTVYEELMDTALNGYLLLDTYVSFLRTGLAATSGNTEKSNAIWANYNNRLNVATLN